MRFEKNFRMLRYGVIRVLVAAVACNEVSFYADSAAIEVWQMKVIG